MTKRLSVLLALLVVVTLATTPVFDAPVAIEASGVPINVGTGGNASPFVVDWNGDGQADSR